jgi:DNA-binding MarR family transcriptional regulator
MDPAQLASDLRSMVSKLHKGLRKQISAADGYSMTEFETIGYLFRSGASLPSELAAYARITTQSMSQILARLESRGIVKRRPSKEDKRKVFVTLTAPGKKMVEKTRYDRDEWLKGLIETSLTAKEKELLKKTLAVLNKLTATR